MTGADSVAGVALATLVDAAPDGLMVLSSTGIVGFINRSGAKLLGQDVDSLIGTDFGLPLTTDGSAEINIVRDGRNGVGICELRSSPMIVEDQSALVVSLRDITKLKEAEACALDAQAKAEAAERAKTQLLWRTSHELRTPLSALVGFADLLALSELNPSQRELLNNITIAGQHLREVINDVLGTAEIDSGKANFQMENVDLSEALAEVIRLSEPTSELAGSVVSLTIDTPETPHVWVDSQRFRQIMLNLLSNAVKYSAASTEIEICVSDRGEFVRVAVIDHGDGVDIAKQDRLFVAFDRLGAEQSEIPGTGLGLVVAKSMTEAMGGHIGLTSQAGEGSTFWVDLPKPTERAVSVE